VMSSFPTVRDLQLQFEIHLAPAAARKSHLVVRRSTRHRSLAAAAANALRLCLFLAISVGDARGA
jgi:hypothetical protein